MKKSIIKILILLMISHQAFAKINEENPFSTTRKNINYDRYQKSTVTKPQEKNDFQNQKRKIEDNINYEEEKQQPIKAKLERLSDKKKKDKK